jgi:hypothetical protein
VLAVASAVCVALHPGFVLKRNEGGFSNYGVHLVTALPYSAAFLGAAGGAVAGARILSAASARERALRRVLDFYAALCLAVLASTFWYQHGRGPDDLHVGVGVAAMVFQLLATGWLTVAFRGARWALGAQLIGFTLGALTFFSLAHLLFASQVLSGVTFGVALVHAAGAGRSSVNKLRRRSG